MSNPLLETFDTPFAAVPFHLIHQEDFEPAIQAGIELAKNEIEQIIRNTNTPDFENTIVALEKSGSKLATVHTVLSNLCSAETNDFLEAVQEKVAPMLAAYSNDILLNEDLFKRIKEVYETTDKNNLSKERQMLLDKTYKSFVRNGALLDESQKQRLRAIDQQLSLLTVKFAQNVLKETNAYKLYIDDEKDLEGLPELLKKQAAAEAKTEGKSGWVFSLQFPSYVPFMKFAKNRELRREMHRAYGTRAAKDNENNNEEHIRQLVSLRDERAKLLGFSSYAEFVLAERMAKSPDKVESFLNTLLNQAKPYGERDVALLKALAKADGVEKIMPYDHAYYAEKLREEKYDYSEEKIKPYFPLKSVLQAAFEAAGKLYGLNFTERHDIPKYHEEVQVFEVLESGKHKALLYTDFHPRKGKRPGAWMTEFKGQYKDSNGVQRPHISIVCNFSRASEEQPSLLSFNEVTTLFHEFGHSLHGMMADTEFERLSGTNVYWDFVELPSQFMENFCYQKEFLPTFAKHYETGEVLPEKEIDKIVASANFMEGYQTLRQLSFGLLDMAYHTHQLGKEESIEDFEGRVMASTQLYEHIPGTLMSTSFSHIFPGGYAAGYYSYKWSEVLDADAFSLFKEKGIFDRETALKFKTLLSKGGSEDPMSLYVAFRGRVPKTDALLERAGLK